MSLNSIDIEITPSTPDGRAVCDSRCQDCPLGREGKAGKLRVYDERTIEALKNVLSGLVERGINVRSFHTGAANVGSKLFRFPNGISVENIGVNLWNATALRADPLAIASQWAISLRTKPSFFIAYHGELAAVAGDPSDDGSLTASVLDGLLKDEHPFRSDAFFVSLNCNRGDPSDDEQRRVISHRLNLIHSSIKKVLEKRGFASIFRYNSPTYRDTYLYRESFNEKFVKGSDLFKLNLALRLIKARPAQSHQFEVRPSCVITPDGIWHSHSGANFASFDVVTVEKFFELLDRHR